MRWKPVGQPRAAGSGIQGDPARDLQPQLIFATSKRILAARQGKGNLKSRIAIEKSLTNFEAAYDKSGQRLPFFAREGVGCGERFKAH